MAAIFQLRRGSGSVSLMDGELYLHKSSGSLQISLGDGNPITLARLDQPNSGSLNIGGNITASNAYFSGDVAISGNLFLGNTSGDNISVPGVFTTNLVPGTNGTLDLGTSGAKWRTLWANSVTASLSGSVNGIDVTSLNQRVGSLETESSSLETRAVSLATITGSLILTASSHETRNANLATISGSLIVTASSHESRFTTLGNVTASYDSRFIEIGVVSGSLIVSASSFETRNASLATISGSLIATASNHENRFADLATISGSLISTSSNHEQRLDTFESESGSYARIDRANSFVGNQIITGSLITSGSDAQFNIKWPSVGTEKHIIKTDGFTLDGREYGYSAVALEHYDDGQGALHNALAMYMFDPTDTYGSLLSVGPYRSQMQIYPSGSGGNIGNVSVQDLKDGTTQALVYADFVQIGAYHAESIIIGNSGSVIEISGSIKNSQLNAIGVITGSLISSASSHDVRFASLAITTGSLIETASNHEQRIGSIESYTSSLKTAIELTGSSVTILGDLVVKGTQTTIDSTTIQIGDNVIELNGSANTNGGLLVKDPTGGSVVSGSLLWDATNDYWKGGIKDGESKILLAGGDSVVSGSSQITLESISGFDTYNSALRAITGSLITSASSFETRNSNLATITGSLISSASSFEARNANLATISGSLILTASANTIAISNLNSETASLETRAITLATISGSLISTASNHEQRLGDIEAKSGSYDIRFTSLATISGSLISTASANTISITNLNSLSASILTQFQTLATETASLETRATEIGIVTASLISSASSFESRFATLATETASLETRATEIGIVTGSLISSASSFESRFATLGTETASLETRAIEIGIVSSSLISSASSFESRFADLKIETGSLETRATTLAQVTSSLITATASLFWTGSDHEARIDLLEYTASISVGAGLAAEFTKINQWTASTDTRIEALELYSASYEQYFTYSGSQFHIDFNV